MVNFRQIEFQFDANKNINPTMHVHRLTATKDTRQFKEGESMDLHICKMSDGRYQIFRTLYDFREESRHEVFSEAELHESFTEL